MSYNPDMDTETKRQRQLEATRRWRERNPDKVQEANRKPRKRIYDATKTKAMRERRLARPGYRERENQKANERAKSVRAWLSAYKLEQGCIDCGYRSHPAALEFDHINGTKELNVCNAKSITQAQKEITKCVVRCSNCHAIRTWERLQEQIPPLQPDHT